MDWQEAKDEAVALWEGLRERSATIDRPPPPARLSGRTKGDES